MGESCAADIRLCENNGEQVGRENDGFGFEF
jgi:hypothetical protein